MKAIRVHKFGGPEVLQFETNVPIPTCGDKEVLVRIAAAGVNPVDTYIRQGTYARRPEIPYTPGADAAGVIEKIGTTVSKLKVGDRVFCCQLSDTGPYAEFAVFREDSCHLLSDKLTFSQGAAIGIPYLTAYRALFQKAHVKPGESVLVHGASGAVGLAAVQLAKAHGLTVFGTAGTPEGLQLVKTCGADYTFNHREPNYINDILKATECMGLNVIIEMLGNVNLAKDLTLLHGDGRVIIVGNRGTVEIDPRQLMAKESSVCGVALGRASPADIKEGIQSILAGIDLGWLRPVIDKDYSLEDAAQAQIDVINSSGHKGKLILNI